MHNAPPVVFPVGRFAWGNAVLLAAVAVSAAGLIAWQFRSQATALEVSCAWAVWFLCCAGAALWGPRQLVSTGSLFWTGEAWLWQPDRHLPDQSQHVSLTVALDTGTGLLLWVQRVDEREGVLKPLVSAWLDASSMPTKWHGFRCAVYSHPHSITPKKDTGSDLH